MIYFIADTHFYHYRLLKLNLNVRESWNFLQIIQNCYNIVTNNDLLIHLGDFTWDMDDPSAFLELWKNLPCKKWLIIGNHDEHLKKTFLLKYFDYIIQDLTIAFYYNGCRLLLSHYPVKDSLMEKYKLYSEKIRKEFIEGQYDVLVHGHVHKNESNNYCECIDEGVNCVNVNVEFTNLMPVSINDIIDRCCLNKHNQL